MALSSREQMRRFAYNRRMKRIASFAYTLLLALAFAIWACGCSDGSPASDGPADGPSDRPTLSVTEDGEYSDADSVALYIHEFGHLPSNYISKTKARKAGWVNTDGNLWDVLPGMSIGGSDFYDDDEQLPYARGRTWKECDVNYEGGYRGAERLVYSNDGLIFYTGDHYKTFEQLY